MPLPSSLSSPSPFPFLSFLTGGLFHFFSAAAGLKCFFLSLCPSSIFLRDNYSSLWGLFLPRSVFFHTRSLFYYQSVLKTLWGMLASPLKSFQNRELSLWLSLNQKRHFQCDIQVWYSKSVSGQVFLLTLFSSNHICLVVRAFSVFTAKIPSPVIYIPSFPLLKKHPFNDLPLQIW